MPVPSENILAQLAKIFAGSTFESASRSRALLEFVVQEALAGRPEQLKEYTIGVSVFGRPDSFDPRTDPIVRAEASRLRSKLEAYYAGEGKGDAIEILLPRGTYVPQFSPRHPEPAPSLPSPSPKSRRRFLYPIAALGLCALAFLGGRLSRPVSTQPSPPPIFLDVELRAPGTVASQVGPDFAISPDGSSLVFIVISPEGTPRLYWKRLDRFENTLLEGTEGARAPFFSPDGSAVAFWAAGKLKKSFLGGGAPVVLCDATDLLGGSWGDDGFIVAAITRQKLSRLPAAGGPPQVILDLSAEGRTPAWPQVLPGSQRLLFTSLGFDGADRARIEVFRPATRQRTTLLTGATHGRILANSWLLYTNQSILFAQRLQPNDLQPIGEPVPTSLRVPYSTTFGYAQYDLAPSGTLLYRRTSGLGQPHWLSESGAPSAALLPPGRYVQPALSPDGARLAISETVSGLPRVLIRQASGDTSVRFPAPAQFPLWTPDANFLLLGSQPHLAWVRANGQGPQERLTTSSQLQSLGSFSPDGKTLVYAEFDPARGFDLWTLPVMSSPAGLAAGTPSPFMQTPAFETHPAFSPDGKYISYASNESGSWEVYVRAFPDQGWKLKVSSGGGRVSRWSRTKRELLIRSDDQRLTVVNYSVISGKMQTLSRRPFAAPPLADTGVLSNFDWAPDGRVLALLPAHSGDQEQSPNHVSLLLNFTSELNRLARSR